MKGIRQSHVKEEEKKKSNVCNNIDNVDDFDDKNECID
jgi:hypothetical protein